MASSFEMTTYLGRTTRHEHTFYEADGTTGIVLDSTDKVRFKLGRNANATPLLDLVSGSPTANKSRVVINQITSPAKATVWLAEGDMSGIDPGTYDAEIMIVDDSITMPVDATGTVSIGIVHVVGNMGGNIGM